MKVWAVIRDYGSHEGYSVPSHIFSNKEAAQEWTEQPDNRGDYELQEYEILDHCPPPRIAQTYENQNFGLFTPLPELAPHELLLYPKFYMMDLMEAMSKKSVNTYLWTMLDRKKTRWERFKQTMGL